MKENNNNKLLVIGNGFDLHLDLNSRFKDFFTHLYKKIDESKEPDSLNYFLNKMALRNKDKSSVTKMDANKKISDIKDPIIKYMYESTFYYKKLLPHGDKNFWSLYFYYLRLFPSSDHMHDAIQDVKNLNNLNKFENWQDIERQISLFLNNTDTVFETYKNYFDMMQLNDEVLLKECEGFYNQILDSGLYNNHEITYNSALKLIIIQLSMMCGWNVNRQNIYSFLYDELYEFENLFKKYLSSQINDDYYDNARKFAFKLSNDSHHYNLINFNYTTFYKFYDENKTNVHSTLRKDGHPIFGIGDFAEDNNKVFNKTYYKFGKTYRIMKLATNDNVKRTLTSNINEIIFYGLSLSPADYAYFYTIFSHYDLYDNEKGIKLTFKYSERHPDDYETTLDKQIDAVYKLINNYGNEINHDSLLHKLLMEKRIAFELVPDDENSLFKQRLKSPSKWFLETKDKQFIYTFEKDSRYVIKIINNKSNDNMIDVDSFSYSQKHNNISWLKVYFEVQGKIVYEDFISYLDYKRLRVGFPTKSIINSSTNLYYYYLQDNNWNALITRFLCQYENSENYLNAINKFKEDIVWYEDESEKNYVENILKNELQSGSIELTPSDKEISMLTNSINENIYIKNISSQNGVKVKSYAYYVIVSHKLTDYINNNIIPYVRKIREKDSE